MCDVKSCGVLPSPSYDSLNQLTSATYGGHTYAYTYDNGGNILSVTKDGAIIKSYTYGDSSWKDLLTSYNGYNITYDAIGNPDIYRDGFDFDWEARELKTIEKGSSEISYSYGENSLRNKKTVNGKVTDYYWLNGVLLGQKTGNEHILFLYDENGSAYGMLIKNGTTEEYYYYVFNAQGDVIGIVDSAGNQVVQYTYSPWGEILSVTGTMADTVGQKNPLRYRGYYYDNETGFYYLQSRYYDPVTQRFLNADGVIADVGGAVLGYNQFAYCMNNPVNMEDDTGSWPDWNKIKKAVKKAVKKVTEVAYSIYYNATKWHFEDRAAKNNPKPQYAEVSSNTSKWTKVPQNQTKYHNNGIGNPEQKYTHPDGREAVFDGDTLEYITDARYVGTYNYCPIIQIPENNAKLLDYVIFGATWVGHGILDVAPYWVTGNSNTRDQFEEKIRIFS